MTFTEPESNYCFSFDKSLGLRNCNAAILTIMESAQVVYLLKVETHPFYSLLNGFDTQQVIMHEHQISTKSHTETSIVVDTQTETVENGH